MFASKSFTLLSGMAATLLAVGCGDSLSPDRHTPEAPDFSHGGAHPRIFGEGTIGTGEPTPGDDRQEFSFDAAADETGRLFYRDWTIDRGDGTVGTVTVDPTDPETDITAFRDGSPECADPTQGAEFDGIGRLDDGSLVGFTVVACDNGPAESGADFFRMRIPALDNYTRSGFLTNGDIVKEPGEAPPPPGPATRISGLGTIGPGTPTPNSDLQEFDFDVAADLTGDLFFRDWSVVRADGVTVATITVDPADPETRITMFRPESAACADPTHGAEFDGTGRLDTGDLVGFTVAACDNGPAESGADFFRLDIPSREYTRSGFLSSGDIVKGTEAPPPEPPAAPTSLTTTPVSSSQIDLSWTDNSTDEDGFKIERRLGTEADAAFAQIAQVGANVTTHSDPGLAASTEYCYRVRAFNAGGNSTYSNTSCATTQAAPPPPPVATQLAFVVQPSTTTAGSPISPAVKVAAQDDAGNTVTSFTGDITVAIGTNPGGGTLSGTKTVAAVNGVATFSDLSIDKVGDGYTLVATASGLPDETSAPFNITPGAATKLVFTVQPSNTLAGAVITPPVKVTAQDANGNTATGFTGTVTVAIGNNPTGDGVLDGTKSVAAVSGVATFSDLSIKKAGNGYTLTASTDGLTGAESDRFDITPGPATHLKFTVHPSNTTAGAFISPPVQVTARDEFGNTATAFTGTVTVAIGANPGGGTLDGTKSVAAVSGVATFSDLSIKKAGNGYTLTASADGLTGAESDRFDIRPGPATHLKFTVQPSNTTAGAFISPPVQVTARDEFGNKATGFTGTVTVAIGANPGNGTLDGTKSVAAVSGVATFSDLSIKQAAKGYTLKASASADGLTGDESALFDITPDAAARLVFSIQPKNTLPLVTMERVQVKAEDKHGNKATSFAGEVTIAIGKNGGLLLPGKLSGTLKVKAVNGYADFWDLSIDQPGPGYTLVANSFGLQGAESNPFDVLTPPLPPLP